MTSTPHAVSNENQITDVEPAAIAVSHQEFATGLPAGQFRVIVNPDKAAKYVKHRLFIIGFTIPLIGVGIALTLWGFPIIGFPVAGVGFILPRLIKRQAGKILLHLASADAKTYREAIDYEIMEVRRAN